MSKGELTPFQEAKKQGLPYLKLVIDERHLRIKRGRIEIEGPFSRRATAKARRFLQALIEEMGTDA